MIVYNKLECREWEQEAPFSSHCSNISCQVTFAVCVDWQRFHITEKAEMLMVSASSFYAIFKKNIWNNDHCFLPFGLNIVR